MENIWRESGLCVILQHGITPIKNLSQNNYDARKNQQTFGRLPSGATEELALGYA